MIAARNLELIIISNDPVEVKTWDDAGVDYIFIDIERIGKHERQGGKDTVISNHELSDISRVKDIVTRGEVLVRLNPLHAGTANEVDESIDRGADILMLPMFESAHELSSFVDIVGGRARVYPLIETRLALETIDEVAQVDGVEGFHFGLNDLHLQYGKQFMFEMFAVGDFLRGPEVLLERSLRVGIGGVSAIGYGDLPAELILQEHCRLGSTRAILSRQFKSVVAAGSRPPSDYVQALKKFYASCAGRNIVESRETFMKKIAQIAARNR